MEHQHLLFEWKKWKNVQHKNIRVYSILHFYIFIVFYIQRIIKEMYLQKKHSYTVLCTKRIHCDGKEAV